MAEMTPRERIQLANERMSITQACRFIGMHLGDFEIASVKTYCPFGELLHEDGGRSKAFRVYPETNSAYCFACIKAYRPVSLIATDRDIPEPAAAEVILEETGYVAPNFMAKWEALSEQTASVDRDALEEALKTYCARISPDWEMRQLDDDIASTFRKCLTASRNVASEDDARKWLKLTKQVMATALQREAG